MVVGVWGLSGDNSLIPHIFLNADLLRKEEPGLLED
jgi:hypothetical protein